MDASLSLISGVLLAGIGGDLFLRGVVGLAGWARVSAGLAGATLAAFATSAPELSVSVTAALSGQPAVSFGDALGSNVVNVSLVLGAALLISGVRCPAETLRRDFSAAVLAPVFAGLLALDGRLSRADGLALMAGFAVWLAVVARDARKQRRQSEAVPAARAPYASWFMAAGLLALAAAGRLLVAGARELASSFGIDALLVGLTIVAVGTSVPELATAVISSARGREEVGLGTVLGSNIFNGLFIVALTAILSPFALDRGKSAVALFFGLLTLALVWPNAEMRIGRGRGVLLLGAYAAYVAVLVWVETGRGL